MKQRKGERNHASTPRKSR